MVVPSVVLSFLPLLEDVIEKADHHHLEVRDTVGDGGP
jgi:hypothetical protein